MIAPFLPHMADEISRKFFPKIFKESIHSAEWPKAEEKLISEKKESFGVMVNCVISALRKLKTQKELPMNNELKKVVFFSKDKKLLKELERAKEDIAKTMKIEKIEFANKEAPTGTIAVGEKLAFEAQI